MEAQELTAAATTAIRRGHYDGAVIRCWDKAEADEVRACLPPDIAPKVQVTWTEFPPYPPTHKENQKA